MDVRAGVLDGWIPLAEALGLVEGSQSLARAAEGDEDPGELEVGGRVARLGCGSFPESGFGLPEPSREGERVAKLATAARAVGSISEDPERLAVLDRRLILLSEGTQDVPERFASLDELRIEPDGLPESIERGREGAAPVLDRSDGREDVRGAWEAAQELRGDATGLIDPGACGWEMRIAGAEWGEEQSSQATEHGRHHMADADVDADADADRGSGNIGDPISLLTCGSIPWRAMPRVLVILFSAVLLSACGRGAERPSVVVYVSLDEHYSRPILRAFEEKTGIRVLDRYDTEADKTTGLYLRLQSERRRPRADVFWNSEVLRTVQLSGQLTGQLDGQGIFAEIPNAAAAPFPEQFRDPGGRWVGFAARARVIIYNRKLLGVEAPPASIADLAHARFKDRAVLALPLFGTTATHAGALRAVLGREAMERLYRGYRENGARIVNGNALVRELVASGQAAVGITDTDDAHEALRSGAPIGIVFPDQVAPFEGRSGPLGTFLIPCTLGIVAGGPHPEEAQKLVEYLLSAEVEEKLSKSGSAQIPLRPGLAPPAALGLPANLRAMDVELVAAARGLEEAEPFLRDLFVR